MRARHKWARRLFGIFSGGVAALLVLLLVRRLRSARRLVESAWHGELLLPAAEYEKSDVGPRFIGAAFALLLASLAVITVGALWLFPLPGTDRMLHVPLPVYPAPRLQPNPREEMQHFLAQEKAQSTTYGWIDKPHGIVRLPIDVAMEQVAKRGIPGWPASREQAERHASPASIGTAGAGP